MALLDLNSAELAVLLAGLNALSVPPPPLPMPAEEQQALQEVRPRVMDALLRQLLVDDRMRTVACGRAGACTAHGVANCTHRSR